MPYLTFQDIGISGLSAAVPKRVVDNLSYTQYFPFEAVKDIVEKTGIKQRRFAEQGVCSSDLCYAAAEKLIAQTSVGRDEIDLLLFVSQTPDYRMPATSVLLQNRLGLPKSTAAFDINLGCSAFVYGLSVAYSFLQQPQIRKVLLLDGETRSKVYHPKDRQVAFLFGDAGIAALIEKNEKFGKSFFSLNSDGSKGSLIKIDAGGYRNQSSPETVAEHVVDEYGNIRTKEHGYMNGPDVFNFVLEEVPKDLDNLYRFSAHSSADIDYFVFHQANRFMNNYLAKKLKLDSSKVPTCLEHFGNTSSVSIPLTISTQLKEHLNCRKNLLLSGFGVGMSWASAIITVDECKISDLVEV